MDKERESELKAKLVSWMQKQDAPDWSGSKNLFEHALENQSVYRKYVTIAQLQMPGSPDRLPPKMMEAWNKLATAMQDHLLSIHGPLSVSPTEISYTRPMDERIRQVLKDQLSALTHDGKIDGDSGEILDEELATQLA